MLVYPITIETEELSDGSLVYNASFPDVPEALTCGDTLEEALEMANEVLLLTFESYEKRKKIFPIPSKGKAKDPVVRLSITTALKVFLHNAMIEKNWRKVDLGRAMSWSNAQVDRALNPRYMSKADALESALAAIGKSVTGKVVDA